MGGRYHSQYQWCVCVCAQVVLQHGGAVLEEYDPAHCTHVLALHKKSQLFEQVSSGTSHCCDTDTCTTIIITKCY